MLSTLIISTREFLEAFLIVGVFLGISKKLKLKREKEIIFAAVIGFSISLLLSLLTYSFGDFARKVLTQDRAEILESYLLIFSGCFIAYVVLSLHNIIRKNRSGLLLEAHKKIRKNAFDFPLFSTIVLLVAREGFEIAIFTASTSLFSVFFQNLIGLMLGFLTASVIGILTFLSYLKFPIVRIFKATEYMIVLLGASLVQIGITKFLENQFNIHISDIFSLNLNFLPSNESVVGHLLQSFVGIDNEFSLIRLAIMLVYFIVVYLLFLRKLDSSNTNSNS